MKQYLKAIKISKNVYWVGALDWGIRDFHGYTTERGSSYNAYLVMGEKITLIDTVKAKFKDELMARIASVIDPEQIDYIVSNHSEMDHSGCLPDVIDTVKPEKVFASPMGVKALNEHFNLEMEITAVKTGDTLDIGKLTLSFIETKMLHWPDSMCTYLKEDAILFSQDAFGMHFASGKLFVDENDWDIVYREQATYFANILMVFSQKIIALLDSLQEMALDIKMIATDHGPIWRESKQIKSILSLYRQWAEQKTTTKAIVMYDSMWGSTAMMASSIADGILASGAAVKVMPLDVCFRSDVATEILEAGALIVGSPTLNNNMYPETIDVLTYLKGLKPKNLIGFSFGSFGWSGEATKQVDEMLKTMNVDITCEPLKVKYVPNEDDLKNCYDAGKLLGEQLLSGQ